MIYQENNAFLNHMIIIQKCPQVAPILYTSATKARKDTSQDSSKNQQQNADNEYRILMKMVSCLVSSFSCFLLFFSICSDPGLHSSQKPGPGPKKYEI